MNDPERAPDASGEPVAGPSLPRPETLRSARVIAHGSLSGDVVAALADIVGRPVAADRGGPAERGPEAGGQLVYVGPELPAALRDERLVWFHSTNAGVDAVLRGSPWPQGALLTRTVGRMGERIAQYVLGWVLADCQDVPGHLDRTRERTWRLSPGELAAGQSAVVFGVGAIGAEVARLLRNCGLRTVGVASRAREVAGFDRVVTASQAGGELAAARWVVSTLPLTAATQGLFDAALFGSLAGATFINVGRGAAVDLEALAAALAAGTVRGAVLDVLAEEPPGRDDPCWSLPRTVITGHSSGVTADEDVVNEFGACWNALMAGNRPRLSVPTSRGY